MHLNDRKSVRTHLNSRLTQNFMLIPNLKSDFQKNQKKSQTQGPSIDHGNKIFFLPPNII